MTRDIEELDSGHGTPSGAWSDGATLWLAENGDGADDAVYAYDLETGERVEEREFELDERNRAPRGVWSDSVTLWIADSGQDRLFAYDLESGERVEEREVEFDTRNRDPRGIWSDGTTVWVLDGGKNALFAYDLASGGLIAEYALDSANDDPRGLWSDGVSVWVSDHGAKRLFAYRIPAPDGTRGRRRRTRSRSSACATRSSPKLSRASNNSPRGIWSDGEVMYVADESDGRVYSYNLPDAIDARLASLTLSGVEFGEFDPSRSDYEGTGGEGVTETTVEAAAMQRRADVGIEPPDADGEADGHQVALQDLSEISVTVSSADGSRTKTYRVRLGETEQESVPEPWPRCIRGDIAVGFSLVVYEGGSVEELEACARNLHLTAVYVNDSGQYLSYILGAPELVNRPFIELFPDGLPPATPLSVASDGPPPAPDADAADPRLATLTLSGVAIGEFTSPRTQYVGVVREDATQATVEAVAVQPGASVLIEPADADGDAANGHQVALEEGGEITVTVTSADGSRTHIYRVWIGGAEARPEGEEPSPDCLRGGIAAGFRLVVYEGGSVGDLEDCARSLQVTAVYVLDDGEFVSLILGAPGFVNRPFLQLWPNGLPPGTPLIVKSEGQPPAADRGGAAAAGN